jgi:CubicO group peptidase (beta-lactamase class C family)
MRLSNRGCYPFSVLLLVALCFLPAGAQSGKLPVGTGARIDEAVSRFMVKSSTPGVAVAVVEDGEFAWAAGYGMADLENSVPVTPETPFRLASVSKPISAVSAMQLWEQGKLDLDAPIRKYCPAFPDKHALITTRELLGHLGGIRHYRDGPAGDAEVNNTTHFADPIAGGLGFFKDDALVAQPGTHFHYSTQGYTLVGCAIAAAAGDSYVDDVRQRVFAPAGMTSTQVDDRFAVIPRRTRFYHKDDAGKVVNAEFLDSSYKIPGGGWISSASDMARFEAALLTGKLVKPETFLLMGTPLKPSDGSKDTYGLGLGVGELDGAKFVGHSGGQQGTSTMILMVPSRRLGVVVLANMDEVGASDLAKEIASMLLAAK